MNIDHFIQPQAKQLSSNRDLSFENQFHPIRIPLPFPRHPLPLDQTNPLPLPRNRFRGTASAEPLLHDDQVESGPDQARPHGRSGGWLLGSDPLLLQGDTDGQSDVAGRVRGPTRQNPGVAGGSGWGAESFM